MGYHNDNKILIDYYGLLKVDFYDMLKKNIDVYYLYCKLKECDSYGCQRSLIYNTLKVIYTEPKIETLWSRYVNHRIVQDEVTEENINKRKVIKKLKEDKKAGRIF